MTAILTFVALAFARSWVLWLVAAQAKTLLPVLSTALTMASGFGPSVAGLAVVAYFSNGTGLSQWIARCLNWRVGWRWFVLAFFLPPAFMLIAHAGHAWMGGAFPTSPAADHVALAVPNFALVLLIGGPLGEEFGWRGYAMSALRTRLNWRAASLVIGAVWGAWHLPLSFAGGTAQSHMPILVFMLNILAGSVVFGWLFERTQASVLPALVFHTSLNAWAGIAVDVIGSFMALLSSVGISTPSLQAQGGQRRPSIFNIHWDIPRLHRHGCFPRFPPWGSKKRWSNY